MLLWGIFELSVCKHRDSSEQITDVCCLKDGERDTVNTESTGVKRREMRRGEEVTGAVMMKGG